MELMEQTQTPKSQREEDILMHYGVKGMRWGIRRKRKSSSSSTSSKKSKAEDDMDDYQRKQQEARRQKILRNPMKLYKYRDEFSMDEINTAMKRMKWERELRQLAKDDISRGKIMVDKILSYGETATKVYNLVNSPMFKSFLGKKVITKTTSASSPSSTDDRIKEMANNILEKKKKKKKSSVSPSDLKDINAILEKKKG